MMYERGIGRVAIVAAVGGMLASSHPAIGKEVPVEEAEREIARLRKELSTKEEWEAHAAKVRNGILQGARLTPLPDRTPLQPIRRNLREMDGYRVESVSLEAFPGFFVTGNLYSPAATATGEGHAGILAPHGHFPGAENNAPGRFANEMQLQCATLARAGAFVFTYDMVGWGESTHTDHRADPNVLGLQLWSSIRSLDFLVSLDGVDPQRLGVTGVSGGGTQTILLTAVDERIAASAPVVMVSAFFFGGCNCESGMPVHRGKGYVSNNADIAALAAPRPQLLISNGKDWTRLNPTLEYPYLQHVYGLHDAADKVELVHLAEEGHDMGPSKRQAIYRFFGESLKLDFDRHPPDEKAVTILPQKDLVVFDAEHPRSERYLTSQEKIEAAFFKR